MNRNYYLAIDIGASSGRHILGHLENGKMVLEEIHRFPNGNVEKDGELTWDVDALFSEVNPIPVKKAMNLMGYEVGGLRMPLTELTEANTEKLAKAMREYGIL